MKKVNIDIICARFIEETNKLLTYVENCREYFKDKKAYLTIPMNTRLLLCIKSLNISY